MTSPPFALMSVACRYPEAGDPDALWQNVLDGRRSFRPIPASRLPLEEYDAPLLGEADSIPRVPAGLLTGWSFSRERFRVPRATYETADLTHWLALDVAAEAIAAVGGPEILPRDRTAVILGDTLTGEFTRSAQIRLRAPYLARKLGAALDARGMPSAEAVDLVADFLHAVAGDFPDPNEESLAGALANTIAGRIANHFDLGGGAWTVDGACASSLLAVADACGRLTSGDVDVAIVGGVDLSLDPFELVGFARAGALTRGEMRVFDRRAEGFWPGEGCGVAILATREAAARLGGTPLGWISGWGVSTDGAGGLTRPTVAGQARALERAWKRAGHAPAEAGLFEAHGTGTAVGDPTEIRGLASLVGPAARRVPVGSIKGNIGHCKAAAGMAGLIKAALALREKILPPHVGCEEPNPVFADTGHRLAPAEAADWRGAATAGVSGFGFGGVNAHLVLEGAGGPKRAAARPRAVRPQDGELFVFGAADPAELRRALETLRARAGTLSLGEMTDAAADAAGAADPAAAFRAAVVARRPEELRDALDATIGRRAADVSPIETPPRVGLLFPGQSAPARPSGGAWARRFPEDRDLLEALPRQLADGVVDTEAAQPAIVAASIFGLRMLDRFGVEAAAAAGHSLGELSALHWGGALDEAACLGLAAARGAAMARHGASGGAMVRIRRSAGTAEALASRHGLAVACLNGLEETVLAGPRAQIDRLLAEQEGEALAVSHAFHSPAMAPAAAPFRGILEKTPFRDVAWPVVSTVTGAWISAQDDLRAVLLDQLTRTVRFTEAIAALTARTDVLVEVGPGAGLTRLATEAGACCLPLDCCAATLQPMLQTLAELWRRGVRIDVSPLFADRPVRAWSAAPPSLLSNPCGLHASASDQAPPAARTRMEAAAKQAPAITVGSGEDALPIVHEAVADELGLPLASVDIEARLLEDLHLNSLSAGRIVSAAAARLGMASPAAVMDLSNANTAEIAAHLTELRALGQAGSAADERVEGVAPWIAEFETVWEAVDSPAPSAALPRWRLHGAGLPPGADLAHVEDGDGALVISSAGTGAGTEEAVDLWTRIKEARASGAKHLAVVHRGAAIEGFLRSLVADGAFRSATLVDVGARPEGWADVGRILSAEPRGISIWRLAPREGLLRPALSRIRVGSGTSPVIGPQDVALVVGGARGIGAECALRLAAARGMSLALVGRSPPDDPAVIQTLARADACGVRAAYRQADASCALALRDAVAGFRAEGLSPSVALHAAGVNLPAGFDELDTDDLRAALAPKLDGLKALLAAVKPAGLKLVIGFGSIIGALGLAGESHYALANGMMAERLIRWGEETGVRTLALDWSVWAGAGMGERLGAVERLRQIGVDAIPLDAALACLERLACDPEASGRRIVTSRFGPPQHVRFAMPPLPVLRFIETQHVHFPGVELVADAALTPGADPWLEDHVVDATPVVPGVMLLEAAAQAALALTGRPSLGFEEVRFDRAIVAAGPPLTLRTAALHAEEGRVSVVLRASDDGFSADRARMTVLTEPVDVGSCPAATASECDMPADLLYGSLFFNDGRFRRILALEMISAFASRVRFAEQDSGRGAAAWFGPFLPQDLVLGDPGARDAGLHALQLCAPQFRVLPVSVARIALHDRHAPRAVSEARETWSDGESFRFDIAWRDPAGRIVEVWQDAVFRAVSDRSLVDLPPWTLPAALERAAATVAGRRDLRVTLETDGPRAARRGVGVARLGLGEPVTRGDGAPELTNGCRVSLSHGEDALLAAVGTAPLGVDLVDRGALCRATLRPVDKALADAIAALPDWNAASAAAAIWAAREALRKVGAPLTGALRLDLPPRSGGIVLRSEGYRVICLGWNEDGCAALAVPDGARSDMTGTEVAASPALGLSAAE